MKRFYIVRVPQWRLDLSKYIDVEVSKPAIIAVCGVLWASVSFIVGFTWAVLTYYN